MCEAVGYRISCYDITRQKLEIALKAGSLKTQIFNFLLVARHFSQASRQRTECMYMQSANACLVFL